MSIISDLIEKKITFSQAVAKGEAWFSNLLNNAPTPVKAGVGQALSDFKQAASDAITMGDTALGPIAAAFTVTVNTAANAALTAAIGPEATTLTPAVDAGIASMVNAAHAEIDAVANELRAKLAAPVAPAAPAAVAH